MTDDDRMADSMREMLLMLRRHGVPVRVLERDELEAMPVGTYQRIANWALRPDQHEQPVEVRMAVRLVKGG